MKVALITGPARGIGEGLARELVRRGYYVSLVGLELERLNTLAKELNEKSENQVLAYEADVTDSVALDRAVVATMTKFGSIDVVVANAGISNNGTFETTDVEDLARVVNVNLIGAIRTTKACLSALEASRGYLLFISSASAFPALPGISAYGASKAGVDHFANGLRVEVQVNGVEVGVAYPSWIDTDLVRDQQDELPYFRKALAIDPWFLGKITTLSECALILADGIDLRLRRIYIPDFVRWMHAFRFLMVSRLWDSVVGFVAGRMIPGMNTEVRDLGRSFGKTSVETTKK